MLLHALPEPKAVDGFLLGMTAVKAAHDALIATLVDGSLLEIEPAPQDRRSQIRYTRNADFTDAVAAEFLQRCPTAGEIYQRLQQRDESAFLLSGRQPASRRSKAPRGIETPAMPRSAISAAQH
jgi:hypothetical protein